MTYGSALQELIDAADAVDRDANTDRRKHEVNGAAYTTVSTRLIERLGDALATVRELVARTEG